MKFFNLIETDDEDEPFNVLFEPENWTMVRRFLYFVDQPFEKTPALQRGISATDNHFEKCKILRSHAKELESTFLDSVKGRKKYDDIYVRRSKTYSALVETIYCELYSCLNGLRDTIFAIYGGVQRVQNKKTSKFFSLASEGKYGQGFPERVANLLSDAYLSWFCELRDIRVEVTHRNVGFCYLDEKSNKVQYQNLAPNKQDMIIDDIPAELEKMYQHVFGLLEQIFGFFCSILWPKDIHIVCGIFRDRGYTRFVKHSHDMSFNSGWCFSEEWKNGDPLNYCPARHQCGAENVPRI
ncbi:MAG: hypothetical protein Q7K29_04920 [Thermoleophilia bacterium]|nr:hypothetical protein [Thermoleophilia bacterium]